MKKCRAIIAEVHGFEHLPSEPASLIAHLERLGYQVSFTGNGKEFKQGHGLGLMRAVVR